MDELATGCSWEENNSSISVLQRFVCVCSNGSWEKSAPYNFDRLFGEDCNAIVFVIVPLISLMKDLVSSVTCGGLRASLYRRQLFKATAGGHFKS